MNLSEFANQSAIEPSISSSLLRQTPFWERAYKEIGNESRTDPTVAAVFSQIAMDTPRFDELLAANGLNPADRDSRECMVVPRFTWGEYVLIVADDRATPVAKPSLMILDPPSLQQGLERWRMREARDRDDNVQRPRLLEVYRSLSTNDLASLQALAVYFVQRPRRIRTSAPIPGVRVTSAGLQGWTTAGCRVRHKDGREGVTSSRHLYPGMYATGISVTVGTQPGVVAEEDTMSDSVFIHVPSGVPLSSARGAKGWLQGVTPTVGNPSEFDGATSAVTVKTAVSGSDPGVASYSPYRQARVYTAPVTNPGDSGSALVETGSDHIIGFAHERTEAGALVEWSSWIWADSVFQALNVRPSLVS
jgi:hypothetical protein